MTAASATRYLFLNSGPLPENVTGYRRKGFQRVERHSTGEGYGSRKTCSGSGRRKKQNNLMQVVSILRRFRMLQIWKYSGGKSRCLEIEKYRVLLNRV